MRIDYGESGHGTVEGHHLEVVTMHEVHILW